MFKFLFGSSNPFYLFQAQSGLMKVKLQKWKLLEYYGESNDNYY